MGGSAELNLLIKAKDQASSILGGIAKAGIAMGLAFVGAAAVAVKAAAEEELGIVQLAQAIKNTGTPSFVDYADSAELLITKWQNAAGVADNDLRPALALLVAQTGDTEEAFRRMPIALDLSRGANIDLAAASKLLGKLTEENVNVFKRLGLTFKDGATEMEVLQAVQSKFGGQSAAFAATAIGQWEILKNKVGDFVEVIGKQLLPKLTTGIGILGEFFGVITGEAPEAGGKLRDAVGGPMAETIMGALGAVRDIAQTIFAGDFPALIDKVITFVGAAIPKLNAQLLQWGHEFIAWVGPQIPILLGELFKMLGAALVWVGEHKEEIKAELQKWGVLFGEFVTEVAVPALTAALPLVLEALIAFATTVPGLIVDSFNAIGHGIVTSIGAGITANWDKVRAGLMSMLTQAIQAIDFWVGPFHISGVSGITVSMPTITLPNVFGGSVAGTGSARGIQEHATGGIAAYTGLHWLEAGERVLNADQQRSSGDVNVYIQNAYGLDDLNAKVASAVRDAVSRGGLRGVTA